MYCFWKIGGHGHLKSARNGCCEREINQFFECRYVRADRNVPSFVLYSQRQFRTRSLRPSRIVEAHVRYEILTNGSARYGFNLAIRVLRVDDDFYVSVSLPVCWCARSRLHLHGRGEA